MYGEGMLTFEKISFDKQDAYLEILAEAGTDASDYSFMNLWGWSEEYSLEWSWTRDVVWIRQNHPERIYWAPLAKKHVMDWPAQISLLGEKSPSFTRTPHNILEIWRDQFKDSLEIRETRGHWDYLYSTKELIELSGNRYHKKKNLLNQFMKKYTFEYVDDIGRIIEQTRAMQETWCVWRDCESSEMLSRENRAVGRILNAWESLRNTMGGALTVGGKVVAFSIAECFKPDTLIIHFEKGFTEYAGVYQAINQMFLAANSSYSSVNREQDLDEEGLRASKLSYHPQDFVRKYTVDVHF